MNNENLKLSLSAVMDNAADELELRRVLSSNDNSVMATWSRYQIAGSVIRKEVVFPKLDLVSAVSKAIAEEDRKVVLVDEVSHDVANQQNKKPNILRYLGKFAVAASILAITVSTVYFVNNDESTSLDSLAQAGHATDDVSVAANDQWIEQRLSNFIDRHEQQGVLTTDTFDQAVNSTDTITN